MSGGAPNRRNALLARLATAAGRGAASCAVLGDQDVGGDPEVSVDPSDHRQRESTAARENLGDSSPRPDERFEIAPGPPELFASQPDRVQWIERLNRKQAALVSVHQGCKGVQLALLA